MIQESQYFLNRTINILRLDSKSKDIPVPDVNKNSGTMVLLIRRSLNMKI